MDSFNPTIKCPHCGGINRPSITGWGREGLNNRVHTCKHCGLNYVVIVYIETSKELEISDGYISGIKSKIQFLKRRVKEMRQGLVNTQAEFAEEFIRLEALKVGRHN